MLFWFFFFIKMEKVYILSTRNCLMDSGGTLKGSWWDPNSWKSYQRLNINVGSFSPTKYEYGSLKFALWWNKYILCVQTFRSGQWKNNYTNSFVPKFQQLKEYKNIIVVDFVTHKVRIWVITVCILFISLLVNIGTAYIRILCTNNSVYYTHLVLLLLTHSSLIRPDITYAVDWA